MKGKGTQRREGINIPEATMVSKLLDAWVAPLSASVAPPAPPVETVVPQQDAHDETPDGQWIASGSFDKIWSVESGERVTRELAGVPRPTWPSRGSIPRQFFFCFFFFNSSRRLWLRTLGVHPDEGRRLPH